MDIPLRGRLLSALTRLIITVVIAVIITLSLLFCSRETCPPGQQWVLSENVWVCK